MSEDSTPQTESVEQAAEPATGLDLVHQLFKEAGMESQTEMNETFSMPIDDVSDEDINWVDKLAEDDDQSEAQETSFDLTTLTEDQDEPSDTESDDQEHDDERDVPHSGEADEDVKQITLYDGEQELHLSEDTEIEITVDGEPTKVKLSEFRNDLSGQKAIARRFSALDQERKTLDAKIQDYSAAEQQFAQLMENGDAVGAIDLVLDRAGINTEEVMLAFFQQVSEPLNQYMELSDQEKLLWAEKVRAEKNRLQYEQLQQQNNALQAEQEQHQLIQAAQAKYGLSDADFVDLYGQLKAEKEAGTMKVEQITPDLVGQYGQLLQRETLAGEALRSIDPKLAKDHKAVAEVVSGLNYMASQGIDITADEVSNLVNEIYGVPVEEEKKAKAQAVTRALKKKRHPAATKAEKLAKPKQAPAQSQDTNPAKPQHFLNKLVQDMEGLSETDRQKMIAKKKKKYRLD